MGKQGLEHGQQKDLYLRFSLCISQIILEKGQNTMVSNISQASNQLNIRCHFPDRQRMSLGPFFFFLHLLTNRNWPDCHIPDMTIEGTFSMQYEIEQYVVYDTVCITVLE